MIVKELPPKKFVLNIENARDDKSTFFCEADDEAFLTDFFFYFRSNVAQTAKIKSTLCSWQRPIIPIERLWSIAKNFVSWQNDWLRNAEVRRENRSNGNIRTFVPLLNH